MTSTQRVKGHTDTTGLLQPEWQWALLFQSTANNLHLSHTINLSYGVRK